MYDNNIKNIKLAQEGKEEALEELVKDNSGLVWNIVRRFTGRGYEAEDIFQNVFIKLYTYDKTFESDIHIKAWLLKVTVNECINTIKSSWNSKVIKSVNDNCEYDDNSSIVSSDSAVNNSSGYTNNSYEPLNSSSYKDFDIDSMYVWETVAALPQKYRDVIYLFYHEQYSTEEISDILGISTVNVRTRLKRAREILRKEVNDYEF